MENKTSQTYWIDVLRAISTLAVIFIHVSGPILGQYGKITNTEWMIGNIYDSSVRFSVPIFLMITGALLLPRKIELEDFLKKRFTRILYPFIFWSFIYILYQIIAKINSGEEMTLFSMCKYTFLQFRDGASLHLWYVYMIIGMYLIFPLTSKWINNSNQKEVLYFICIWLFLIVMDIPKLSLLKPKIDLIYFYGMFGYPILGYYLTKFFHHKHSLKIALALILTGTTITIVGTYLMTKHSGAFNEYLYNYLSPSVLLSAVGVFLFFKSIEIKSSRFYSLIHFISKYSYGVYLSHMLILIFLSKAGLNWSFINPNIGIPLTAITVLFSSITITYLISKIPYGHYISG